MNAGLWIDYHKAVVVSHVEQNVDVRSLYSNIDRTSWQSAVWRLPDMIRKRMLEDEIGRFYQNVSECILPAEWILIFGPGGAKGELRKQLGLDNYRGSIMALEQAGKMSDLQIIARIGTTFGNAPQIETSEMQLEEGIATWCSPICATTHRQHFVSPI